MPCHPRYLVVLLPALILLPGCLAKTDDLGRVRVLYLGNTVLTSIMSTDPTVQVYPVPAYLFGMKEEDVHRFLRTYMPRTYAGLVDSNDVIYVGDSGVRSYTPAWLGWMSDGVVEGGMGFVMSGGSESFGGRGNDPSWGDASVGEVMGVTCNHVESDSRFFKPFRLVVQRADDALMSSLPFETAPRFHYLNMEVFPKIGSVLLATANLPDNNPAAVVMEAGRGRSLSFMPYITDPNPSVVPFSGWEFYVDFIPNLMIYGAQAPLPTDYMAVHALRSKINGYSELREMALEVLSFAEKLGANIMEAQARIASADAQLGEAKGLYIRKELVASAELMDQAVAELESAEALAIKAKDAAFLWIYIVEWLAVTCTLMITGAILWELMVRRAVLREAATTRAIHSSST